jgi:hypothetical protein
MVGVDRWEGHEDLVALHNGRGLPYVDFSGTPLPKDTSRDRLIVEALKQAGALPRNRKDTLDYDRSELMYDTVRHYFDNTDPLMNTERWMGSFVEKNKIAYTDRDGQTYVLRGGIRRPVGEIVTEDEDEDDDLEEPGTDWKLI